MEWDSDDEQPLHVDATHGYRPSRARSAFMEWDNDKLPLHADIARGRVNTVRPGGW